MNTSDILVHTYTFQYAGNEFIITSAFIIKQVMEGESIMYGEFTVALDKLGLIKTSEYIHEK